MLDTLSRAVIGNQKLVSESQSRRYVLHFSVSKVPSGDKAWEQVVTSKVLSQFSGGMTVD